MISCVSAKIFVTTGDPKDRGTNLTEVIDLSSPYTTCENLDYYPKPMAWGPGGLLNGTTPIICGGTSYYGYGNQTDCFLYIKGDTNSPRVKEKPHQEWTVFRFWICEYRK